MGGGVPANTTTTTTVNQSPWQNPTYQALMLGTQNKPGPITNILRSNQGYMDAYNTMLAQGTTPADIINSNKYNPTAGVPGTSFREVAPATETRTAASGGIMNARGFAPGGTTTPKKFKEVTWGEGQESRRNELIAKQQANQKLTQQEKNVLNSLNKTYKGYQAYQTQQQTDATNKAKEATTAKARQDILEQSMGRTAFTQVNPVTGQLESTNPLFNQAVQRVQEAQKLPEQFGLATDAYKTGLAGLQNAAQYQADKVTTDPYTAARMAAPTQAEVKDYDAAQMNAASMQGREAKASQINRGDVRDINAIMADVERYQAAGMQAPPALQAEMYQAAQMQGAQLEGPKSWTDAGTAQKYMSPYQQAVTDQELYEANRQAQMRENQQRSQATQQKAFGGTRAALQESEGRRNLGYLLSDIQNKGSQQAYQSGMGQFSAEQGLGLQAGQSNLQAALTTQQQNQAALNQQRSLYVQQALDAAKTSYGGELTAAQANQVAANAASQFNAGAQNLAYNNYSAQQLAAQQANQSMDWNVANQNAQLAKQAELANQQYGLGGFQSNLNNAQFQQQAAQQNQAAINQQRQSYVNNALQAAMQAYGGQLTAEQQNQAAANAAAQFNAQQNLQGQMANQQAGLQANQQKIGAYGQYLQGAGGLGALGAQQAQTNLANIGALGQAASAWQNLGQQYLNTNTQNAQNAINFPSNLYGPAVNMINSQSAIGGNSTQFGTSTPASWMGGKAEGGEVEAHKEWDKAKGGTTVKKGIASKGWN